MARGPGRPKGVLLRYTEALGDEVCERMKQGESVRQIAKSEHMPPAGTIYGWFVDDVNGTFAKQFAAARDVRAIYLADQILSIADNVASAVEGMDRDAARAFTEAAKLQMDARKWWAARVAPRRFGDRGISATATTEAGGQRIIVEVQQVDRDE